MNLLIPEVTIEECAEVIQAISKIKRFGMFNSGYDNRKQLETEIGQLRYMIDALELDWELDYGSVSNAYLQKREDLIKYAKLSVVNQTVVD